MTRQAKRFKVKKAFSMITAIFVIVIMATVTALIMNVTGKTIKETTQQYQKEQAALLARSYTEQALLYALHYDRATNGNCINKINATFGDGVSSQIFNITTNIQYASNETQLSPGCNRLINLRNPVDPTDIRAGWEDNGTAGFNSTISLIIDVYVSYKDFDDPSGEAGVEDRNVTFHRRTLQKL
ncbi:MAG: Unknown protein [uncultured Sulfurovum sp.]|uniref:Type II secretion system protein n=1 Tax=uncultured Sulfurovum sp. TaxID=269237 RepID=A0A6S6TEQ8_9BACT|nr:MAG: Unknown protein [uncultured Sulfurovum sp.]